MNELTNKVRAAKRVYIIGNGGSAANACHIANDLVSVGVRAYSLTANVATLTAIANDYGYEHVFARQLKVYGEVGDLLIALSGSGKSPNILRAIEMADKIGMTVHKVFGAPLNMQSAEELQIVIGHRVMRACIQN